MENYKWVDLNLAPKGLRFANYLIDFIFCLISMCILGIFLAILGMDEIFDSLGNPLIERITGMLFYFSFMFFQELIMGGKSIGKLITGTKVVTDYGYKPTTYELFIRNISRIVPFDAFSFLGNLGWHDKWSETRVVKTKTFDDDISNNISIDEIGNSSEER